MNTGVIETANNLILQRLVRFYLSPEEEGHVFTIEGACVTRRQMGNRYGVPADATSWRFTVENPEYGWSFTARAVWRDGKLMSPTATHTVIEEYYADDTNLVADEDAARLMVNDWLQSVPL